MITGLKVIFGFLFICFLGGLFFYTIFDLKPWRKDSYLWKALKQNNITLKTICSRETWVHIRTYYMYYGLALILIGVALT